MDIKEKELDLLKKDLGLKIIQSYERWGTWLVSLSVTSAAALSVRHGIVKNAPLDLSGYLQFIFVGLLLLVAVFFSAFLVGDLKYVGVNFVSGGINDYKKIPEAILNEKFGDESVSKRLPHLKWLSKIKVYQASAIAGVTFGTAIFIFVSSELILSAIRVG